MYSNLYSNQNYSVPKITINNQQNCVPNHFVQRNVRFTKVSLKHRFNLISNKGNVQAALNIKLSAQLFDCN
jgi:hypothetical protein